MFFINGVRTKQGEGSFKIDGTLQNSNNTYPMTLIYTSVTTYSFSSDGDDVVIEEDDSTIMNTHGH